MAAHRTTSPFSLFGLVLAITVIAAQYFFPVKAQQPAKTVADGVYTEDQAIRGGAAYDAASWESQGQTLGENGAAALAVEDTSPSNLRTAIRYLKEESGVESVALIGASAGARPVLEVGEEDPEKIDQIILLSGIGDVSGLGEYPKLFVASEGEEIAERVHQMADEASGDRNEALILSGDAHAQAIFETEEGERLMQVILERIEEYG